jgi:cytochrome c
MQRFSGEIAIMTFVKHFFAGAAAVLAFGAASVQASEDGAKIFRTKCMVCHDMEKGKHKVGPSLHGIYGRQAGTVEGFTRYVGLKGADYKWDKKALDEYLTDPEKFVKAKGAQRSAMAFKLPNAKEREAVIDFMEKGK